MSKKLTQNVNKDNFLNDLPIVKPDSSSWLNRWAVYQSCNIGQIVPIHYEEILPGTIKQIKMQMTSHTSTPIAPIFPAMYTEIRAFWVPMRLCADLLNGYKTRKSPWVKVFGEDPSNTSSEIIVSLDEQKLPSFTSEHQFIIDCNTYTSSAHSWDNVFESLDLVKAGSDEVSEKQNFLNLAAYELIYQRHYRNENFEASTSSPLYRLLFDAYNANSASVYVPGDTFFFEVANREKDYFTGVKPFTQKGDPITVGLTGDAPIGLKNNSSSATLPAGTNFEITNALPLAPKAFEQPVRLDTTASNIATLYADLSSVSGISIEELRLLIKTQELLEKDAMYGTRYSETLNAHFGCAPLDITLNDPLELYKTTITSNMQAIFQTSSTSGEQSILGSIGANSTTQTTPFIVVPERKFEEHGILMICAVHKLQNVYNTKVYKPKFNFKHERFDFYTPELNDLGFMPVTKDEVTSSSNLIFGFNEAFAEYRYVYNKVRGQLAREFPYWAPSIGVDYNSASKLYKEDPGILDQALSVTSATAPQFYDAWGFESENTLPMSLHSIPGMDGVI